MTDGRKRKILFFSALAMALFYVIPTALQTAGDLIYFSNPPDWHAQCKNDFSPWKDYYECVNADPRPLSPFLIVTGLIGTAIGWLTFLVGRRLRPRYSSLIFAFIFFLPAILFYRIPLAFLYRFSAGEFGILDVILRIGVLILYVAWFLAPIIVGWLLGLFFRVRDRTEKAAVALK